MSEGQTVLEFHQELETLKDEMTYVVDDNQNDLDQDIIPNVVQSEKEPDDIKEEPKIENSNEEPPSLELLSKNLWVKGLTTATKAADLKELFDKHGKVMGVKVISTSTAPNSLCFGLINLSTPQEASLCISKLNNLEYNGTKLAITFAQSDPTLSSANTEMSSPKTKPNTENKKLEETNIPTFTWNEEDKVIKVIRPSSTNINQEVGSSEKKSVKSTIKMTRKRSRDITPSNKTSNFIERVKTDHVKTPEKTSGIVNHPERYFNSSVYQKKRQTFLRKQRERQVRKKQREDDKKIPAFSRTTKISSSLHKSTLSSDNKHRLSPSRIRKTQNDVKYNFARRRPVETSPKNNSFVSSFKSRIMSVRSRGTLNSRFGRGNQSNTMSRFESARKFPISSKRFGVQSTPARNFRGRGTARTFGLDRPARSSPRRENATKAPSFIYPNYTKDRSLPDRQSRYKFPSARQNYPSNSTSNNVKRMDDSRDRYDKRSHLNAEQSHGLSSKYNSGYPSSSYSSYNAFDMRSSNNYSNNNPMSGSQKLSHQQRSENNTTSYRGSYQESNRTYNNPYPYYQEQSVGIRTNPEHRQDYLPNLDRHRLDQPPPYRRTAEALSSSHHRSAPGAVDYTSDRNERSRYNEVASKLVVRSHELYGTTSHNPAMLNKPPSPPTTPPPLSSSTRGYHDPYSQTSTIQHRSDNGTAIGYQPSSSSSYYSRGRQMSPPSYGSYGVSVEDQSRHSKRSAGFATQTNASSKRKVPTTFEDEYHRYDKEKVGTKRIKQHNDFDHNNNGNSNHHHKYASGNVGYIGAKGLGRGENNDTSGTSEFYRRKSPKSYSSTLAHLVNTSNSRNAGVSHGDGVRGDYRRKGLDSGVQSRDLSHKLRNRHYGNTGRNSRR